MIMDSGGGESTGNAVSDFMRDFKSLHGRLPTGRELDANF